MVWVLGFLEDQKTCTVIWIILLRLVGCFFVVVMLCVKTHRLLIFDWDWMLMVLNGWFNNKQEERHDIVIITLSRQISQLEIYYGALVVAIIVKWRRLTLSYLNAALFLNHTFLTDVTNTHIFPNNNKHLQKSQYKPAFFTLKTQILF